MKLALLTLAAFAAGAAQAHATCSPRAVIVQKLAEKFDERRQMIGLVGGRMAVLEVFASSKTRTWTVLVTRSIRGRQIACIVSAGKRFKRFPARPQAPEF